MHFLSTFPPPHLEALEMNDHELRRAGDGDLFRGFPFTLAVRTFPDFVAAQALLFAVAAQTVVYGPWTFALRARDLDADGVEGFIGGGGAVAGGASQTAGMLSGKSFGDV